MRLRQSAVQPAAALGHALRASQGTFADDFTLVGGKAGQQDEPEAAGGGIEVLGEALDAQRRIVPIQRRLAGEEGAAADTVQPVDQQLIEAVRPDVLYFAMRCLRFCFLLATGFVWIAVVSAQTITVRFPARSLVEAARRAFAVPALQ